LIYKNVSVSILMSSVLSTCGLDYSNSLWMPGLHTLHVYFLYHLTWCRVFFIISCKAICPLVSIPEHARSFYNFYHLQDKNNSNVKILPDKNDYTVYRQKNYTLYSAAKFPSSTPATSCRTVFNNLSRCLN
jgi:hypothetical protein